MNISNEEIKQEFKRQVNLCAGIGQKEMIDIISEHFPNTQPQSSLTNTEKEIAELKFFSDKQSNLLNTTAEKLGKVMILLESHFKDNLIVYRTSLDMTKEDADKVRNDAWQQFKTLNNL